ncbi:Vitrin [Exaiptasia diaphana]|nr:Vitrin [Exaiptasia diaphana]
MARLLSVLCLFSLTLVYVRAQTCKKPADVAILLDASGSIGRKRWPKVAAFTKSLVNSFGVSEEGSHFAVVMYATNTAVVVDFDDFTGAARTPENINAKIDEVDYNEWKGMTYIDRGLDTANRMVFTEENGMRPDKKKILILFTDGKQTKTRDPYTELDIAAQPLKAKGVEIHALGIGKKGKIDVDELGSMATKPEYVYTAESFDDLLPMALRIIELSCDLPRKTTSVSSS